MTACKHIEHRHDRASGRRIGLDARLNEWQPCPPADLDEEDARIRAELDRITALRDRGRLRALDTVTAKATAGRLASAELRDAVKSARVAGATWQQIGDAAGITRQSAHARWTR